MNQAMERFAALGGKTGLITVVVVVLALMPPVVLGQDAAAGAADKASETAGAGDTADATVGLAQLADLLENEATRAKVIEALRKAARNQLQQAPAEPLAVADLPPRISDAVKAPPAEARPRTRPEQPEQMPATPAIQRLARITGAWVEAVSARAGSLWHMLLTAGDETGPDAAPAAPAFDTAGFWNGLVTLILVIVATLAVFFVLRVLAASVFVWLAGLSRGGRPGVALFVRRLGALVLALAIDLAVVLLAGGAGYAAGLLLLGDPGQIGTRETLFINAFVVVEMVKAGIRAVFSSRYDELRLMRMSSSVAGWWGIRLRWFVGVTGYSLLVVVPIIKAQLSPALGDTIGFVVMAAAYVYALGVIFGNRKLLSRRLRTRADRASLGFFRVLLHILAGVWIVLALAYFTAVFVAAWIAPAEALPFILMATLQTFAAAAVALSLSGLLSAALGKRIAVPERTRRRLPMLEHRINAYVPIGFKLARLVIVVAFALVLADIWHVFDVEAWLASAAGNKAVGILFHLLVIFAAAIVLWILLVSLLEHRLGSGPDGSPPGARQETLMGLIRNVLAIVIVTITVMVALAQIGVDIGPLLAAAGVLGLAVGFGAQQLVADVITGVFIQLENAMNTGDVVSLAGISGTAEKLTIRSVSVRDLNGTLHVVPFSSASVVSNYMREFAYHTYHYRIAYREDIDEAIRQLRAAFEDLQSDAEIRPNLLEDIAIPGVTTLAENAVEIRVMIKTLPGTQWAVGRAYNRLVKIYFDAAGIEIPTAQRTLYFGRDKDGWSPPARVRMEDTGKAPLRGDAGGTARPDTAEREADTPARDGGDR